MLVQINEDCEVSFDGIRVEYLQEGDVLEEVTPEMIDVLGERCSEVEFAEEVDDDEEEVQELDFDTESDITG